MEQISPSDDRSRFAKLSIEERLNAFKRMIAHPHFVATSQAVQNAIQETGSTSLVFVCGPAGVGKTAMKNHVISCAAAELLQASRRVGKRGSIPSLFARPPLNGSFSWRDFLLNVHAAFEPLVDQKIAFDAENNEGVMRLAHPGEFLPKFEHRERTNDGALRTSLESLFKQHRPAAIIIDDAQHLGKVSSERQLQNQLDCIKSLADITETVHVLIGTYELLALRNVSAQIVRRSIIIHFPRYRSTDEELSQFKGVLSAFQDLLPFEEETGVLLKHWEYCYERSLGCVGILHDMLLRAVHSALWSGEKMLSEEYLKRYALSETDCNLMMREINEGERECPFGPGRTEL
jgi:AAA domain